MMRTAFTPGIFSAALMSMLTIFACACGQRSILAYSTPGRLRSYAYFARPETLKGPSMREMRLPIKLRLSASGHLYSGIVPSFCHLHHRCADTHIGSAPAEVAAQPGTQLFACGMRMVVEKSFASDEHARSR